VIPSSLADATRERVTQVQRLMVALVAEALPGVAVEVRPEPERVCPQGGCLATSLGAVFHQHGDGCVVVATVGPPGRTPRRLAPWGGAVDLKAARAEFRSPPESLLVIRDYLPCSELLTRLAERKGPVVRLLGDVARAAGGGPKP